MNPLVIARIAAGLRVLVPFCRKKVSRKVGAGIGVAALIAGQVFPEYAVLADLVAGIMIVDSAVPSANRRKTK